MTPKALIKGKELLAILLVALGLFICQGTLPGLSQPSLTENPERAAEMPGRAPSEATGAQARQGHIGDRDSVYFYAFLENNEELPTGPVMEFLKDKPLIKDIIEKARGEDRRFRPMMQLYYWANKPEPFLLALLFSALTTLVTWSIFSGWMAQAETTCRQEFWKSILSGVLVAAVTIAFMRSVFLTQIGWPLGVALAAVFQMGLLCGFGVAVSLLGTSVSYYLHFEKWPFLAGRQDARRVAELFVGVLICALLLQIPGVGNLPRIGTRLVTLLAVLGAGGLYRSRRLSERGKTV